MHLSRRFCPSLENLEDRTTPTTLTVNVAESPVLVIYDSVQVSAKFIPPVPNYARSATEILLPSLIIAPMMDPGSPAASRPPYIAALSSAGVKAGDLLITVINQSPPGLFLAGDDATVGGEDPPPFPDH